VADILHIPVDREVSARLRWLVTQRWLVVAFGLVVVLVADHVLGGVLPSRSLFAVLGCVFTYNALFYVLVDRVVDEGRTERASLLMHAQIIADLVALTALLHFSGGLENPFSTYYVLIVGLGSILMSKRDAYIYAGVASLMWLALLLGEATGLIPHYNLEGFRLASRYREPIHIAAETLVVASANLGVTYIGTSIIERLREGERQLFEANASCEYRAEELRRLNARLEELDRTRSLFIRLVTHELRAPVAAIKSYLRLILDGYVPEDRVREIIARSEQRAGEQLDLIQDLLDLAHIQQHIDEPAELVDVTDVLKDVLELMEARIDDQDLEVTVDADATGAVVLAQKDHIRQLWTNLISNAVKYTPPGGRVSVSVRCEQDRVHCSVKDTGIGIRPEELSHIFEDFYRTEEAKAMSRQGTGLGLSIVRAIAERYGGSVDVQSEVGKGSTFSFVLPLCQAEEREPADQPAGDI